MSLSRKEGEDKITTRHGQKEEISLDTKGRKGRSEVLEAMQLDEWWIEIKGNTGMA